MPDVIPHVRPVHVAPTEGDRCTPGIPPAAIGAVDDAPGRSDYNTLTRKQAGNVDAGPSVAGVVPLATELPRHTVDLTNEVSDTTMRTTSTEPRDGPADNDFDIRESPPITVDAMPTGTGTAPVLSHDPNRQHPHVRACTDAGDEFGIYGAITIPRFIRSVTSECRAYAGDARIDTTDDDVK